LPPEAEPLGVTIDPTVPDLEDFMVHPFFGPGQRLLKMQTSRAKTLPFSFDGKGQIYDVMTYPKSHNFISRDCVEEQRIAWHAFVTETGPVLSVLSGRRWNNKGEIRVLAGFNATIQYTWGHREFIDRKRTAVIGQVVGTLTEEASTASPARKVEAVFLVTDTPVKPARSRSNPDRPEDIVFGQRLLDFCRQTDMKRAVTLVFEGAVLRLVRQ
jgi:hypothetical protein